MFCTESTHAAHVNMTTDKKGSAYQIDTKKYDYKHVPSILI
jgi:hypothetical protein